MDRHDLVFRDIAGVTGEAHRPSGLVFQPRIELSEFADWSAVRAWSQAHVCADVESWRRARLIVELKFEHDDAARIVRALRFVQDDICYIGFENGAGAYWPSQPATMLSRRYGDCKDKVLLLVALLRGLASRPIRRWSVHGWFAASPTAFRVRALSIT